MVPRRHDIESVYSENEVYFIIHPHPFQKVQIQNISFFRTGVSYRAFFTHYAHKKHHRKDQLRIFSFVMTEYITQKAPHSGLFCAFSH